MALGSPIASARSTAVLHHREHRPYTAAASRSHVQLRCSSVAWSTSSSRPTTLHTMRLLVHARQHRRDLRVRTARQDRAFSGTRRQHRGVDFRQSARGSSISRWLRFPLPILGSDVSAGGAVVATGNCPCGGVVDQPSVDLGQVTRRFRMRMFCNPKVIGRGDGKGYPSSSFPTAPGATASVVARRRLLDIAQIACPQAVDRTCLRSMINRPLRQHGRSPLTEVISARIGG